MKILQVTLQVESDNKSSWYEVQPVYMRMCEIVSSGRKWSVKVGDPVNAYCLAICYASGALIQPMLPNLCCHGPTSACLQSSKPEVLLL